MSKLDYNAVSILRLKKEERDINEFRLIASRTGTSIANLLKQKTQKDDKKKLNKVELMKAENQQIQTFSLILNEINEAEDESKIVTTIYSLVTDIGKFYGLTVLCNHYCKNDINKALTTFDCACRLFKSLKPLEIEYIPKDKNIKKELENIKKSININYEKAIEKLFQLGRYLYPEDVEKPDINESIINDKSHVFPMDKIDNIINPPLLNDFQQQFIINTQKNINVVYCAPPGKGKTAAMYMSLAQCNREGLHLIIVPTDALMIQVYADILKVVEYLGSLKVVNMVDFNYSLSEKEPNYLITTYQYAQKILIDNADHWFDDKPWKYIKGKPMLENLHQPSVIYMDEIHTITQDFDANLVLTMVTKLKCPIFAMSATLAQPEILQNYIINHHHSKRCLLIKDNEKWNISETNDLLLNNMSLRLQNPIKYYNLNEDIINTSSTLCVQALKQTADYMEKIDGENNYHNCFKYVDEIKYKEEELEYSIRMTIDYQKGWEKQLKKKINNYSQDQKEKLKKLFKNENFENKSINEIDWLKLFKFLRDNNRNPSILCPENPAHCEEIISLVHESILNFENSTINIEWRNELIKKNKLFEDYEIERKRIEQTVNQESQQILHLEKWLKEHNLDEEPYFVDIYTPHNDILFSIEKIEDSKIKEKKRQLGHWFRTSINWDSSVMKLMKHGIGFITTSSDPLYVSIILELFKDNYIGIIIADPTRLAGLNLPVRTVTLYSDPNTTQYTSSSLPFIHQAMSRAGRRGYDSRAYWNIINGTDEKLEQILTGKLSPLHCDSEINLELLKGLSYIIPENLMKHITENLFHNFVNNKPKLELEIDDGNTYNINDIYIGLRVPELMKHLNEIKLFCVTLQGLNIELPKTEMVKIVENEEGELEQQIIDETKKLLNFVPENVKKLLLGEIYRKLFVTEHLENVFENYPLDFQKRMNIFKISDGFPNKNCNYFLFMYSRQIPPTTSKYDLSIFKNQTEKILITLKELYHNFIIPTNNSDSLLGFIYESTFNNLERYMKDHHRP